MPKRILPLLAALTMTACASGVRPMAEPVMAPPAMWLLPLPDLPQPQSADLTDLLANHVAVARLYHQCRDQLQGLTDWLEALDELR